MINFGHLISFCALCVFTLCHNIKISVSFTFWKSKASSMTKNITNLRLRLNCHQNNLIQSDSRQPQIFFPWFFIKENWLFLGNFRETGNWYDIMQMIYFILAKFLNYLLFNNPRHDWSNTTRSRNNSYFQLQIKSNNNHSRQMFRFLLKIV